MLDHLRLTAEPAQQSGKLLMALKVVRLERHHLPPGRDGCFGGLGFLHRAGHPLPELALVRGALSQGAQVRGGLAPEVKASQDIGETLMRLAVVAADRQHVPPRLNLLLGFAGRMEGACQPPPRFEHVRLRLGRRVQMGQSLGVTAAILQQLCGARVRCCIIRRGHNNPRPGLQLAGAVAEGLQDPGEPPPSVCCVSGRAFGDCAQVGSRRGRGSKLQMQRRQSAVRLEVVGLCEQGPAPD